MDALKDLFGAILERAGPDRARALKLRLCWRAVAGPMVAARVRAEVVGSGLVLHAEDARWAAELASLAPMLRARLEASIGKLTSVDVRIDREPRSAVRAAEPLPPPVAAPPGLAEAASRIADRELRERLQATAERYLAAAAAAERREIGALINLLSLVGAAVVAIGLALLAAGVGGALRGVFKRRAYRRKPLLVEGQGIWSGAVTAAEVYVPGTISGKLATALAGLLIAALGAPLLWSGIRLGSFTRVDEPQPLARIATHGANLVVTHTTGERVERPRPGPVVVAHAEFIEFGGAIERLGLGRHARLVHISGYRSAGDVLSRRPMAGFDVAPRPSLHATMERVEKWFPSLVQATRRFSPPMPASGAEVSLWGTADGLEWRR